MLTFKTKPVDYLTTHQAVLKISGYVARVSDKSGFALSDSNHTDGYPDKLKDLLDQFRIGYSSFNQDTGYLEAKIDPAGLMSFWNIMSRIDVHTTNH